MKDKLLIMGVDGSTSYAIDYCRSIGVYTIITDFFSAEEKPVKRCADEFWTIDVKDIDELEKRCREEHVTGVFAGIHEICLDMAKELAKRLDLPFYASDEGWACARNKTRFKDHCIAVGLDVPKRYYVTEAFEPEILAEIQYPVIVKPVDSSAQRGLSLCHNEEELRIAYKKALGFSASKNILVEDFFTGEEIIIEYHYVEGKHLLTSMGGMIKKLINGRENTMVAPMTDRFYAEYMEKCHDKMCEAFRRMDVTDGSYFLQAIYNNGRFYFLEFGYRLDGPGTWLLQEPVFGYNKVNLMVDLALGRKSDMSWATDEKLRRDERRGLIYFSWLEPGKIAEIRGVEELEQVEGIEFVFKRFSVGDVIERVDNMFQIAYYIDVVGKDNADMIEKVKLINEKLAVIDENGNDLFIRFDDYDALRK